MQSLGLLNYKSVTQLISPGARATSGAERLLPGGFKLSYAASEYGASTSNAMLSARIAELEKSSRSLQGASSFAFGRNKALDDALRELSDLKSLVKERLAVGSPSDQKVKSLQDQLDFAGAEYDALVEDSGFGGIPVLRADSASAGDFAFSVFGAESVEAGASVQKFLPADLAGAIASGAGISASLISSMTDEEFAQIVNSNFEGGAVKLDTGEVFDLGSLLEGNSEVYLPFAEYFPRTVSGSSELGVKIWDVSRKSLSITDLSLETRDDALKSLARLESAESALRGVIDLSKENMPDVSKELDKIKSERFSAMRAQTSLSDVDLAGEISTISQLTALKQLSKIRPLKSFAFKSRAHISVLLSTINLMRKR
ncbi:MAG: hypothetical protein NUW37_16525 [Planctomycetes bacterium]|nr:hypothetical protein [Planctomycetota bacterium]